MAWEILTCRLPYHDEQDNILVNVEKLKSRMDLVSGSLRPDLTAVRRDAPAPLLALITRCWDSEQRTRPKIGALVQQLDMIVQDWRAGTAPVFGGGPADAGGLVSLPGTVPE